MKKIAQLVVFVFITVPLMLAFVNVQPSVQSIGGKPGYEGHVPDEDGKAYLHGEIKTTLPPWQLIWNDEFNTVGNIDSNNWLCDLGTGYPGGPANWGTGEIQSYTCGSDNLFQNAGYVNIRALHVGDNPVTGWTSSRIETIRTDFQPPLGGAMLVEARLQLPNVADPQAQGYWPAFWMLGSPFRDNYMNWPGIGEIDIMENINGINRWWGTLHCGTSPNGPCSEPGGIGGNTSGFTPSLQGAFHIYRMEFERSSSPQEIRWYVDDVLQLAINSNQVDATAWNDATNHGFFVLLNLAMGGGWAGAPTVSTSAGGTMLVDYVRVYYRGLPVVNTILRSSQNPISASSVNFTVTFSESVTGVDVSDFKLKTTKSITGAKTTTVTDLGLGSAYIVSVDTAGGTGMIRLDVNDNDSIMDTDHNPLGGIGEANGDFTSGEIYTIVIAKPYYSFALNDGWLLESKKSNYLAGKKSNVGDLLVGDDRFNMQYRSILNFNTASLPDRAVITKATVLIKKMGVTGTDPSSTHGDLIADMKKGFFGFTALLELGDFKAAGAPIRMAGRFIPATDPWYILSLGSANFKYINLGGVTQFRLRFALGDNNKEADYISFYSGDAATSDQPQLVIEYYVP